ncbi:MAG: hypothetical protein Q9169_007612 [Polycauliona sp. 2 TL-2023]
MTLWHLHILTEDLPDLYGELTGGDSFLPEYVSEDDQGDLIPYDPHDPQEPPYGEGHWDEKEKGYRALPEPMIIASPGEWE